MFVCFTNYNYVKAETPVEYFFIEGSLLKLPLQFEVVRASIWKSCAATLIRAHFMDSFSTFTRIEIGKICALGTYVATEDNESITLTAKALLLTGEAMYSIESGETYKAPVLLLPSPVPYVFDINSRLLLFNNFPATPANSTVNPRNSIAPWKNSRLLHLILHFLCFVFLSLCFYNPLFICLSLLLFVFMIQL